MVTPLQFFEYGLALAGDIAFLALSLSALTLSFVFMRGVYRRSAPKD